MKKTIVYEVKVSNDRVLSSLIGLYLVPSTSGDIAADIALSECRKDNPDEKDLRVSGVREIDGDLL